MSGHADGEEPTRRRPPTDPAVSDRILTIPNLVSFARIGGVGWFLWLLLGRDDLVGAAIVLLVVGLTDWVDGALARSLGQVSRLGAMLDPVADRLAVGAAVIGGLVAGVVPALIAVPLLVRELVVAGASIAVLVRTGEAIAVRYLGKVATFLLYGAIPAFYLASAGIAKGVFAFAGWVAAIVGLVLYYRVGAEYVREAIVRLRTAGGHPRA